MAQVIDLGYKCIANTAALNKRQGDLLGGNLVISGFNASAQATPTMSIDIKMGTDLTNSAYISGVRIEETVNITGAWTINAGSVGQVRYDLLCCRYVYGTQAATASYSVITGTNGGGMPSVPDASYVVIGYVTVTGAPTAITQAMITASQKTTGLAGSGTLSLHPKDVTVHLTNSDGTNMTYVNGDLTMVQEYQGAVLVKQTDLTYVTGVLTSVRDRYYTNAALTNDLTTTFTYVGGNLTNVARSGS